MTPTAYGFRCGDVQRIGDIRITWEHCCYHIRGFTPSGKHIMQTAKKLRDARYIASTAE